MNIIGLPFHSCIRSLLTGSCPTPPPHPACHSAAGVVTTASPANGGRNRSRRSRWSHIHSCRILSTGHSADDLCKHYAVHWRFGEHGQRYSWREHRYIYSARRRHPQDLLLDASDFLGQTLSAILPFPKSASQYTQHHHLES